MTITVSKKDGKIELTPSLRLALAKILAHRGGNEWCGYLVRTPDSETRIVTLKNERSFGGFLVANSVQSEVNLYLERNNLKKEAFLHSHPTSDLSLSQNDLEFFFNDSLPWVIFASINGHIQWRVHYKESFCKDK